VRCARALRREYRAPSHRRRPGRPGVTSAHTASTRFDDQPFDCAARRRRVAPYCSSATGWSTMALEPRVVSPAIFATTTRNPRPPSRKRAPTHGVSPASSRLLLVGAGSGLPPRRRQPSAPPAALQPLSMRFRSLIGVFDARRLQCTSSLDRKKTEDGFWSIYRLTACIAGCCGAILPAGTTGACEPVRVPGCHLRVACGSLTSREQCTGTASLAGPPATTGRDSGLARSYYAS